MTPNEVIQCTLNDFFTIMVPLQHLRMIRKPLVQDYAGQMFGANLQWLPLEPGDLVMGKTGLERRRDLIKIAHTSSFVLTLTCGSRFAGDIQVGFCELSQRHTRMPRNKDHPRKRLLLDRRLREFALQVASLHAFRRRDLR